MEQTHFNKDTPLEVRKILEMAMCSKERIRIFYGDTKTGRDWLEENDVIGTIGRSTGTEKVPLLIHNSRSRGGDAILDHCIVKIMNLKGRTLYQHERYYLEPFSISTKPEHLADGLGWAVLVNDEVYARFSQERQAQNYCEYMSGARFAK